MIENNLSYFSSKTGEKSLGLNKFISIYVDRINNPLTVINQFGFVNYYSNNMNVAQRKKALESFFNNGNEGSYCWGRSIFSEVVSLELLNDTFFEVLNKNNLFLDLVPTSMDRSSMHFESNYQKGADICVFKNINHHGRKAITPICGIDITLGSGYFLKYKRIKPAFQSRAAMPVLVLPLREIAHKKQIEEIIYYLDNKAKISILENGKYIPFEKMSNVQKIFWKYNLCDAFKNAINLCRSNLSDKNDERITNYAHLNYLFEQLNFMSNLVKGIH